MRPPHRLLGLLFALCAIAVCSCGREGEAPGPAGEGVRVAALSPAIGVIVRDLGCAEMVVARHAWDMALPREVPVGGDQAGIDYEALLRARPTAVLLQWGSRELPPRLVEIAAERGWRVENYELLTLEQIRAAPREIGEAIGAAAPSGAVERLEAEMARAWSVREGFHARAGKMLALFGADSPGAAGPRSFHADLIEALGGECVPSEGAPFITLDAEDVRRLDPDSIVVFTPGETRRGADALPEAWRGLGLRAIREGRVLVVDDPLCLTPSTAMIGVADAVAEGVLAWPERVPSAP